MRADQEIAPLRVRDGKLLENWYIACLSSELKPRGLLSRTLYDSPYVLFRDADGRAAALPDRCLHRHAQLSKGAWLGGRVGCPYHGWVYDSNGRVIEVPSEGPDCRVAERSLCLKPLKTLEQDGCVWVWMGEGEPTAAAPPFRFPHFGDSKWGSYFMVTDFDNEVTHLAENFMDVPHTVFVHRGWFRNPTRKRVPIRVQTAEGSVLVTYEQPEDSIGFTRWILNPRGEPMFHTDRFILPNLTRVDYSFGSSSAFIIISQCTPVTTLRSRVYTAIIYRVGILTPVLKPFFRFYTRRVIQQDVEIMANQGGSFRQDFECRFQGTDADIVHTSIERLRELASQGSPEAYRYRADAEKTIWI